MSCCSRTCGVSRQLPARRAAVSACAWAVILAAAYPAVSRGAPDGSATPASRPVAASAPAVEIDPVPPPPAISRVDQTFLTRLVRRALAARLRGEDYEPPYAPPSLQKLACPAAVTFRREGRLLGTGDGGELPLITGCQMAVEKALFAAQRRAKLSIDDLRAITIEIELAGPRVEVGDGTVMTEELADRYHPGLDGIAATAGKREILVRPSQLISMETFCVFDEELDHRCDRYRITLDNLHERLGLRADPPAVPPDRVIFSRFRTTHWVEPGPEAEPVQLVAGLIPTREEELTRPALLWIADDLARYIRYRQNSDGLFSYEFLPGRDMYWPDQNWVRQAATCWALAHHATRRPSAVSEAALQRALAPFIEQIQPLRGVEGAAYVSTPDRKEPLGVTAMVCLAMLDSPQPDDYAEHTNRLAAGMAALQLEDGSFRTCFPPASGQGSQDYYPGEALLAIARHYSMVRDAHLREVCDRALPFYQEYFRRYRPPMFVPWQVQAWGCLARTTQLRKYADFVFEMSDFLLPLQIEGRAGGEAIYNGAFDVHRTGRAGISTAVYVEGLVESVRTAEAFQETGRASRYREAIRKAARFVVQLRFRPEEAFYVQSPQDVIGGMRDTPSDPTLRIDHSQHALSALLGAVEVAVTTQPE